MWQAREYVAVRRRIRTGLVRVVQAVLLLVSTILSACVAGPTSPPPRPALPAIHYVAPCDDQAVAGLTQESIEALRQRDAMWQRHIEQLERQLHRHGRSLSLPALPSLP